MDKPLSAKMPPRFSSLPRICNSVLIATAEFSILLLGLYCLHAEISYVIYHLRQTKYFIVFACVREYICLYFVRSKNISMTRYKTGREEFKVSLCMHAFRRSIPILFAWENIKKHLCGMHSNTLILYLVYIIRPVGGFINLEVPVPVQSRKSSNVELS